MSFKTISLSLIATLCILFVFISIISDDIPSVEGKNQDGGGEKVRNKMNKREVPSQYMNEFTNNHDEIHVGGKRFKLFERKHLNYKKAKSFCKKKDGKLAEAMNLDEMRRLQVLLMRARSVGNDMWIGADKKEWKKHSFKMQRKPNFGPDPMMFGGGPTEMCPALSISTRSLAPVSCIKELAFICEFDQGKKPTKSQGKTKTKSESNSKGGKEKNKSSSKRSKTGHKLEMRRKRQVDIPNLTTITPSQTISNDDGDDDPTTETTESSVTENTIEAAAEHNIGFAPHVEHLLASSNVEESTSEIYNNEAMEKLGTEKSLQSETMDIEQQQHDEAPKNVHRVKLSTKIIVDIDNILKPSSSQLSPTKSTTTLDPDQMLMDMIDEQTMNLTAIELEAAAESMNASMFTTQHATDLVDNSGKPEKISEYMDDNHLVSVSPKSSLTTDDPNELNKMRSSVIMDINTTTLSISELVDDGDGNVTTNDTLEVDNSIDVTSDVSSSLPSTIPVPSTTISSSSVQASIEVDGNSKRAMRNVSHSNVPQMDLISTKQENINNTTMEEEEEQRVNGTEESFHSTQQNEAGQSVQSTTINMVKVPSTMHTMTEDVVEQSSNSSNTSAPSYTTMSSPEKTTADQVTNITNNSIV